MTANDTTTQTPDESTRPTAVKGKCSHPMTTSDGALDRCGRKTGHAGDHNSTTALKRAEDRRKAGAAWVAQHDPEVVARRKAANAKKLATLKALAAELGYTITKDAEAS